MPDRLVVTAPASSANLGPGFDCMAIALDLRNRVELRRQGDAQVVVESEGEGAGEAPGGPDNLFVRAFEAAGADSRGLTVRMTNRIPFARGLGSSAATIAAGLVAGRAWAGAGEDDLLSLATALEGHPDNVAAALNGGVTLAWTTDGVPAAVGLGDPGFELVAVVPSQQLSTAAARAALPASVPHADAVHTAARAALLVAALGSGDGDLLAQALDDRLHEPYRAPLAPLLGAVRERLPALPGALGATLSGAGPAVLVWCRPEAGAGVADLLFGLDGAAALPLAVAESGAMVERAGADG
ncbi:MAG: homoserine kinase [Gaiellales bacterium]|jgi:homoserine kinase